MIYTTVVGCIAMTGDLFNYKNLIDCKSFLDYTYFVIQKVVDKMMIDFNAKNFTVYMNNVGEIAK